VTRFFGHSVVIGMKSISDEHIEYYLYTPLVGFMQQCQSFSAKL